MISSGRIQAENIGQFPQVFVVIGKTLTATTAVTSRCSRWIMVPIGPSSSKIRSRSNLSSTERPEFNILILRTRAPLTESHTDITKHVSLVHLYGIYVLSQM